MHRLSVFKWLFALAFLAIAGAGAGLLTFGVLRDPVVAENPRDAVVAVAEQAPATSASPEAPTDGAAAMLEEPDADGESAVAAQSVALTEQPLEQPLATQSLSEQSLSAEALSAQAPAAQPLAQTPATEIGEGAVAGRPLAAVATQAIDVALASDPSLDAPTVAAEELVAATIEEPVEDPCHLGVSDLAAETTVPFAAGSSLIADGALTPVIAFAEAAAACDGVSVEVLGHTDTVGTDAINVLLSMQRAQAVIEGLSLAGVDVGAYQPVALGATRPASADDTAVGHAANRRVTFRIVTEDER